MAHWPSQESTTGSSIMSTSQSHSESDLVAPLTCAPLCPYSSTAKQNHLLVGAWRCCRTRLTPKIMTLFPPPKFVSISLWYKWCFWVFVLPQPSPSTISAESEGILKKRRWTSQTSLGNRKTRFYRSTRLEDVSRSSQPAPLALASAR